VLHDEVCAGSMSFDAAQRAMATDSVAALVAAGSTLTDRPV